MGNRCLNDLFCYCTGMPKATTKTEDFIICEQPDSKKVEKGKQRTTEDGKYIVEERTSPACKLDIKSCGHYSKEG